VSHAIKKLLESSATGRECARLVSHIVDNDYLHSEASHIGRKKMTEEECNRVNLMKGLFCCQQSHFVNREAHTARFVFLVGGRNTEYIDGPLLLLNFT
jgi:hypothetical protein